ncbi:DUF535 family protein [Escherichia coli]
MKTHIYRSLRYRDKEGKIHADYNAFWGIGWRRM